jgi:hypothetical protein
MSEEEIEEEHRARIKDEASRSISQTIADIERATVHLFRQAEVDRAEIDRLRAENAELKRDLSDILETGGRKN